MASQSDLIRGILRASRPGGPVSGKFTGKLPSFPRNKGDKKVNVNVGRRKGQFRFVNGERRKRRFTYTQRQGFRDRRAKDDVFGGPKDGRPSPRGKG